MEYNSSPKTYWAGTIFIALMGAVLLYALVYVAWVPKSIVENQQNNQITEVSDWKTYRNDEYGFEFQYPNNWTIVDRFDLNILNAYDPEKIFDRSIENGNNYPSGDMSLDIKIDSLQQTSENDLFERYKKIFRNYDYKEINGQKAFYYIHDANQPTEQGNTGTYISYNFVRNGYPYIIKIYYNKSSDGIGERIISTFKFTNFVNLSIRNINMAEYLTNKAYLDQQTIDDYCGTDREPIYITYILYADLDSDGEEEAIVRASSCYTGTAGPDINEVYKILSTGEIIQLERDDIFQGKSVFDGYNWKNYGLTVENKILLGTWPIYNDGDANCCPTGGTKKVYYQWNGKEFIVTNVVILNK